jgi:hypothetical protein
MLPLRKARTAGKLLVSSAARKLTPKRINILGPITQGISQKIC